MGFTVEQQSVIDARNSNVLVSAAAGSGKTTVLVERIIQRITGDKPIDIDRLLVVTFTKAAASSMKDKILEAISKKLEEDPGNAHLQRQETLVHGAQITTIDSFCQYVIRNNFNEIGLDPSYRVGDEGEMKLLMQDVLAELLEEKYAEGDEAFLNCTEYFSTGKDDTRIEDFILSLYNYAMSMPFPEDWLIERKSDYEIDEACFEEAFFVKDCKKLTAQLLEECEMRLQMALSLASAPDGPYVYCDLLEKELGMISGIRESGDYSFDELRAALLNVSFDRLPSKKDDSVNADKREAAKDHRNYVKKKLTELTEKFFSEDKKTICKHMNYAKEPVAVLADLAISFKEKFDAKKREKGIIDFGDMEHLALQILVKNEDGKFVPTNAARQYRDYYEEVMIDEYQDSNNVQEMLLSVISGEEIGNYNRFMVGDVKQSIYKFRLARPEIFMEKMESYGSEVDAKKRKISLHNNFRSRREVLDSVNYIFEQIMGKDLGGVSYNDDAALIAGASFEKPDNPDEFATEYLFVDAGDEKKDGSRELEARMIAARIKELMADGVVSAKDGGFRKVRYSDIVILMRATSGFEDIIKKVFDEQGIPAYIESKSGYFSAIEVEVILNLLRVISNPLQDIPLVSVMHSPICGFSDEELAIIKAVDRKRNISPLAGSSFYEILKRSIDDEAEGTASDGGSVKENNEASDTEKADIPESIKNKIRKLVDLITKLRYHSEFLPVNELIKEIYELTGYYEYCAALPGGERRSANLNMLAEKAAVYEKTSYRGVFHFVRYIEQLGKYEVDFGEAGTLDENADVVRLMSIHKSKGLEFPICFVAGMSKSFNFRDIYNSVVSDMDLGIGTHAIDLEKRILYRTLRKRMMEETMKMDILGEEMRILYVAMTRAKEKLILTGSMKLGNPEKKSASDFGPKLTALKRFRNRDRIEGDQPYLLPFFLRSTASSYQDLLLMALARHPAYKTLCDMAEADCEAVDESCGISVSSIRGDDNSYVVPYKFRIFTAKELEASEFIEDLGLDMKLKDIAVLNADEKALSDSFKEKFLEKYAYVNLGRLFVKTTVSELKKAAYVDENEPVHDIGPKVGSPDEDDENIPSFVKASDKKLFGAERGTVYHKIMELIYDNNGARADAFQGTDDSTGNKVDKFTSYDERLKTPGSWIEYLEETGMLADGAGDCVNTEDITAFCSSSVGLRMKTAMEAGHLHRESQFMMGVSSERIDKELPPEELVLIQGIIDVWFEEDDGIVLLDYKTDKVRSGDELIHRYKVQLDYYQEALERITGKKVKERIIYSFTLGETISVP
jgi:ATP-dependent helicase/nuclease subunit A